MEISISDDTVQNMAQEKPWFTINTKKQHNIQYDVCDKYTFNDFKSNIKDEKHLHIIVPIFPDCYKLYKDIIKGTQSPNILYIDDIIKQQNQYDEDSGLQLLKNIDKNDIIIHIVYLGDSFLSNYLTKRKQGITNKEEIEEIEREIKHLGEIQRNYYTELFPQCRYTTQFINYNFGTQYINPNPEKHNITIDQFQYFADNIVKLLYTLMDKKVQVKQYDMPERYFIKNLFENLGFYA